MSSPKNNFIGQFTIVCVHYRFDWLRRFGSIVIKPYCKPVNILSLLPFTQLTVDHFCADKLYYAMRRYHDILTVWWTQYFVTLRVCHSIITRNVATRFASHWTGNWIFLKNTSKYTVIFNMLLKMHVNSNGNIFCAVYNNYFLGISNPI